MPLFSDQILEEIKARNDIVDLVSQRVPLKRAGADFKACCPFHHEKTPSFIVSPSRRTFHCFGCGAHGDIFKFLMLADGMTFPEAVKSLADKSGVTLETVDDPQAKHRKSLVKMHGELAAFFQRCLWTISEASVARAYLQKRGLTKEIAEQFKIGYAPLRKGTLETWAKKYNYDLASLVECGFLSAPREDHPGEGYYEKFKGRLMFPICDQGGQVIAFSGRILTDDKHSPKYYNSPETPIFKKSRVLYGLCFAKREITRSARREALICEGQIDVIRCHSSGFANAVASQGTAFTEEHVSLLGTYADSALLVFDGDAAGLKAATRTGRLFLSAGMPVNVAILPPGEDPDSLIRDKGPDAFKQILESPISLPAFQIKAMREAEKDPDSADAVERITNELFETFASCSKAVTQTCFLKESAELLKLPIEALETDFKSFMTDFEKRRQWQVRNSEQASNPHPSQVQRGKTIGDLEETAQVDDAPWSMDNLEEADLAPEDPDSPNAANEDTQDPPPEPRQFRFANTAMLSLAGLLVKISTAITDDNRAIAEFIAKWLPDTIRANGVTGHVVSAALADWEDGADRLAEMAARGTDEERALIDTLSRRPSPAFASEMPIGEVVKDLVTRSWIEYLKLTRDNTDMESEDGQNSRLRLSFAIKRLESNQDWESRSALLSQLL